MRSESLLLLSLALSGTSVAVADSHDDKSIALNKVSTAPVLDGRLDDAAWQQATIVEDLHEVSPNEFEDPAKKTRILVLYDEEAIYVGAKMFEDSPDDINTLIQVQAGGLFDDRFALMLDPFNNGRSGYMFELNALSVRDDALFQDTTEENWEWDGIWQGRSAIDDDGWIAEIRIPFKTLSFDPGNDTWGINFARYDTRADKQYGWVSRNRTQDPSIFGTATGISAISQGRGLDLSVGLAASHSRDLLAGTDSTDFEPSIDAFYRISPSITAAVTINTDFSGTDVDEVQVNLDRFGLFFPEQRDFFLRDADIFEFGRIGGGDDYDNPSTIDQTDRENGRPFFSRRIGLSDAGPEVGIDYGGKLTGRIGDFDFGAMAIQQEAFEAVDESTLFVGRGAMRVFEESAVGFILTDGDPNSNLDNTLVGVDFRYLNTRLPGGRTIEGAAWWQQTDTEGLSGDNQAFGANVSMPNTDAWKGAIGVREIQENYNPALGFVNRTGVRDYTLELGYTWRPGGRIIRTVFAGVDAQRVERLAGGVESRVITFRAVDLEFDTSDVLRINVTQAEETVFEPFLVNENRNNAALNIEVPNGTYDSDEISVEFVGAEQRAFTPTFTFGGGDFFGGDRDFWTAGVNWRPTPTYTLGLETEVNYIDMSQGKFSTRVYRFIGDIAFSSEWSWENFAQYDDVSDTLGWNSILRWIPQAGREMLIVANYGAEDFDETGRFNTATTEFTFKLNHTFRF